ncbi:phosphatase PAP2 family protein [Candidatus Daviesbacteria bacterium]|nr:phosphatase PAP2 family protein [Candidatus Daviesbacteria bacterium]
MDNIAAFLFIFDLAGKSQILDNLMIFAAKYLIYFALVFAFAMAIKMGIREKKAILLSIFGLGICLLLVMLIRLFYIEPRPFVTLDIKPLIYHSADPAFPSIHTSIMSVIAFAFIYYKSKLGPLLLALALLVGSSRVYVGVHYPLDIIGGFLVAWLAIYISWAIKGKVVKYLRSY